MSESSPGVDTKGYAATHEKLAAEFKHAMDLQRRQQLYEDLRSMGVQVHPPRMFRCPICDYGRNCSLCEGKP